MKAELKFVENEADKKELYAEFYLEKNDLSSIVAVILIDNETHELKEKHILEETYDEVGDFIESTPINYDCDFKNLINILIENEKDADLTRNYFY